MTRRTLFAAALLAALCGLPLVARAQTQDRARAAAEIESLREQIKAREALLLAPAREDLDAFAEFLAQPRTGIVRLLPREKWDGKLSMRGGGSYYSFTRLTHEYGFGSDISLEQNQFGVGFAGANFGFLANLGTVLTKQTYVVRSVNYGTSDVLVAFRVVRKDSDGSVVVLWKMLKKFSKPELERTPSAAAAAAAGS
ncbi:MAG: hypothetical protein LC802_02375 [Acidobacteria bacterium]|nr:hypothetical protein [Acidobacteriota bacterium]